MKHRRTAQKRYSPVTTLIEGVLVDVVYYNVRPIHGKGVELRVNHFLVEKSIFLFSK
jgi:hypothetical protein